MRPVVSTTAAAVALGVSRKHVVAYLQRQQMPRLEGYPQTTCGPARRNHAWKVYADSVTALQQWSAAQNPLHTARKGLPAA